MTKVVDTSGLEYFVTGAVEMVATHEGYFGPQQSFLNNCMVASFEEWFRFGLGLYETT